MSADTSGVLQLASNNGTVALTIGTTQNIGFGTASPNFECHISTGSTTSITQPTAGSYGLYVQQNTSGSVGGIYIQDGAANSGNSLVIADNNGAIRLVVDGDGSLGIGTSSLAGKLTVVGTSGLIARITGASGTTQQGLVEILNSTNGGYLAVAGIGASSVVPTWTGGSMVLETVPAGAGDMILDAYTGSLIFQNGRNNSARFLGGGDFCVGTSGGIGVGAKCNFQGAGNVLHVQSTSAGANNIVSYDSAGTPRFSVSNSGTVSKTSGSFKIDHPLPQLEATHHLVHSFVEAPQADNIYRGRVDLVNGVASVNIDTNSGMTDGTFVALNREVQCFTTNESDWTAVRGSVNGNILTIEAENGTSTANISWMVIGERQDKHMMETEWTDDNGKVIVEPLKIVEQPQTETPEGAA
jgi:hypothetical protein